MNMNIKTKFKIGEHGFIIKQKTESYRSECSTCGGDGKVHIRENGAEMKCPDCNGKGYDINFDTNYYKEEGVVNKIFTETNDDGTDIVVSLFVNNQYIELPESLVLTAKEVDKILENGNASEFVIVSGKVVFNPDFYRFESTATSVKEIDNIIDKEIPKNYFNNSNYELY